MRPRGRAVRLAALSAASLLAVGPFLWLLGTSFKGSEELFANPPTIVPRDFVLENYSGVWNAVPFARYLLNSTVVVAGSVLLNVLVGALAGYALARYRFPGRGLFFALVLGAMMLPREVVIIPVYTNVLKMGLADTLAGVILPFAVEGFGIFLMRQAFLAVPREVEEAGLMDGASPLRLWWSVMLPMTAPSLAALTVFTFIGTWGDFLWPLVVLTDDRLYTLPVALAGLFGEHVQDTELMMAGAVVTVLPVMIVFLVLQRYYVAGITAGGLKG